MRETRVVTTKDGEKIVEGYFLTMKQLKKLTKDSTVSISFWATHRVNTKKWIETWIKNNEDESK